MYELIDMDERAVGINALPELLVEAETRGFAGVNITYPCKQAVIPLLAELSEEARAIYKTRAQVAETPNLWIKEKFKLRQFRVRGLAKVEMEALWACLTYNIRVWMRLCWRKAVVVQPA